MSTILSAMARIASFHIMTMPMRHAPRAMVAMATDRRHLRHSDGCTFWRLLGTGAGTATTPGADLRRWAMFATWRDERDLEQFLATSPVAQRWQRHALERYDLRMAAIGGHGTWNNFDVIGHVDPAEPTTSHHGQPVVMLTRAVVKRASWRTFARATQPVDAELHASAGLLAVSGVGEAPVGRQATVSIWTSMAAARDFAYRSPEHAQVVERTRNEQWYGEELFARFTPLSSAGTWNGVDPLASHWSTVAPPAHD
jgi:hypothetical protein